MSDHLSEIRFWSQVMTDAKRTVMCSPEMESRCKGYVSARGLSGLITVKASRAVPDDRLLVINEQATTVEALRYAQERSMTVAFRQWGDIR